MRSNYNIITMKKLVYLLAVGSLAFTACNNSPAYKVSGTVEGLADGDTIYLQEYKNGDWVKLDSTTVAGGTFTFTGRQDTATNCFIIYAKDGKRNRADFFLENGNITVALGEENKIGGTANNDTYQQFKDNFIAMSKEMNDMYRSAMSDSTLTDEQRENVMKEIEKKDSIAMDMVFNTIEANITNAVGIQLLPSYAAAFELDKQKSLVEKIPAQFANNDRIVKLKKHIETVEKTAVGQKYIDFSMDTPEGQTVKLSDFISKNKYT